MSLPEKDDGESVDRSGDPPDALASSPALAATALDASGAASTPPPAPDPEEDEPPDPMLGKVLSGLYKVEHLLGEGGMGAVYSALHVHLNKKFAVKVLSDRIAKNKDAIKRLQQEAQAASSIENDHIVEVVNFDVTPEGSVFIVMELLKGLSLGDLVDEGPIPLERALPIVVQIARALHAAHEKGIVHRDLKPENVFITQRHGQDFAKVLDFGISKVKSADAEDVRMTKTGQLVGTPLYMSPEQAKGETDVDKRADVYALGVILYEVLTGVPPFEGGNYFQLLWKHGNEAPVPPRRRNPKAHIPEAVEAVILKALEKERADRFQSMLELEAALIEAAPWLDVPHGHTPSFPSLPPGSTPTALVKSRAGVVALAVLATLSISAALFVGLRGNAVAPDPSAEPSSMTDAAIAQSPPSTPGIEQLEDDPPSANLDAGETVPDGVAVPSTVAMSVSSSPAGAAVFLGDERIGTTPFTARLPAEGPLRLRFSLRGHAQARLLITPEEGGAVQARLRRRDRGSSSLPIKQVF
ncbi:MAG: protein kinase [Deltaproteobacteria bacterium]|nr:protein kinase [Deltaproteobacteria bacterium]